MGLLEDAIREHLELKRRSGADPTEVTRLEREAFGPVSAEREAAAPAEEAGAVATAEDEPAHEPVAEASPAPDEAPPAAQPPPAASARGDQPTQQFTLQELEDAQRREPAPAEPEEPEPAEPEPGAPGDDEPHDELEQTPEFLQETPEHEKLWFEQKPPKDFDF